MFYLKNVATQANLPLIYHVAQRLKSVQDGIDPEASENLYVLSDLAESVIRCFQDTQGWSLQLYSSKVRLPTGIFAQLPSHAMAQEIADKRYLPEELAEKVEDLVKESMRTRKRKLDGSSNRVAKKAKPATANGEKKEKKKLPVRKAPAKAVKTPKKKTTTTQPSSVVRKSARGSNVKNYAEEDDSDEDEEMADAWDNDDDEANKENKENVSSSTLTPPTSDPTPAPVPLPEKKAKKAQKVEMKPTRQAPQRGTRATRHTKPVEKDIMDVPSDSDEELSDVPSDIEV